MPCSCAGITDACTREGMFRTRLRGVLASMQCQYPSLFPRAEFWRPAIVSPVFDECGNELPVDSIPETWVRLGEDVLVFAIEKNEKLYVDTVGLIRQRVMWMLTPGDLGLQVGDHAIFLGKSYIVTEVTEQLGIGWLKLDQPKSRFKRPARTDPTYRQLQVGACIQ